ncbi:hypothetical protein SGFS_101780 [Streptomyces graminofaciens]|uniref:Uncharacterized protein n=1 Tax=Streptomyces graminofaciens TaxID=68212 RepID=A0ABN5VZJ1_9ACTN|nr:hypothetical protein SGFS_101780 [Streptomyces graminofaciens]
MESGLVSDEAKPLPAVWATPPCQGWDAFEFGGYPDTATAIPAATTADHASLDKVDFGSVP